MERKTPAPYQQVSKVRDEEDAIVPVAPAVVHALEGEEDEEEVGEGVDDLGRVGRRVVVLYALLLALTTFLLCGYVVLAYLLTPVERGCYRGPVAVVASWRVGDCGQPWRHGGRMNKRATVVGLREFGRTGGAGG